MRRALVILVALTGLLPATARAAPPGWAAGPQMHGGRAAHTVSLLPSGKVLVAGGSDGDAATASAELFDPVANAWSVTGSMKGDRSHHVAAPLADGRVLVAGGFRSHNFTPVATAEIYDPAAGTWSEAASMALPRTEAAATVLPDGRVLVSGGADVASAEIYDPAVNRWTATDGMLLVRRNHSATLMPGGWVLVIGLATWHSSAEVYYPQSDDWNYGPTSLQSRGGGHAAVLLGSRLLIAGGVDQGAAIAHAEYFSGSGFYPAGAMLAARRGPVGTLLDDGDVLISGGLAGARLASAELYETARNTWSSAGAMSAVRYGHAAVRLGDGRVLVTGGFSNGPTSTNLRTTDVWTPVTSAVVPAGADAGAQAVGSAGEVSVSLINTGDSKLLVDQVALGGAQADEYAIAHDACSGAPVLPGGQCRIGVHFTPRGVDVRTADLRLRTNTAPASHTIRLLGSGFVPEEPAGPVPTASPTPAPTATPPAAPRPSARVAVPFRSSFSPPPGLTRAKACRGKVTVQLRAGSRVLATATVRLDRRCRYSTTFRIARSAAAGRKTLSVVARFRGNRYLAPTRATYRVKVPTR